MAKKKANGATKGARVGIVLDESGSMAAIAEATRDGINTFTRETADADPDAKLWVWAFNTSVRKIYDGIKATDPEPLDHRSYSPNGGTALLDAIGRAIAEFDKQENPPEKTVLLVMTDGEENSSHEYTRAAVQALIKERETKDNWQVLFLGANVDAFAEAGQIGMTRARTSSATWDSSNVLGATAMYATASASNSSYLRGFTSNATLTQDAYDQTLANLSNSPNATATTPPVAKGPAKPKRAR